MAVLKKIHVLVNVPTTGLETLVVIIIMLLIMIVIMKMIITIIIIIIIITFVVSYFNIPSLASFPFFSFSFSPFSFKLFCFLLCLLFFPHLLVFFLYWNMSH